MVKKESLFFRDWYRKANKDINRTEARLKEGDMEDAAFHLQQSIEKYLKGYLLSEGWKLRRIHDLESLLDEAIKYNKELERFRSLCQEVTGYYFTERYPFVIEEPSYKEINDNLKETRKLIEMILPEKVR